MANIETQRDLPFGAVSTYRAVAFVDGVIARVRALAAARRTAIELSKLTDAQLHDIGITRGDIRNVSNVANFL